MFNVLYNSILGVGKVPPGGGAIVATGQATVRMEETTAAIGIQSPDKTATWQRFTLLDAMLLFPAYALAAAFTRWTAGEGTLRQPVSPMITILLIASLGSVVAGPIILLAQFLLRRRRTALSTGEALWLAPLVIPTLAVLASVVPAARDAVLFMLLFVVLPGLPVVTIVSSIVCFASVRGRKNVPCYWTDRFGLVASLGVALILCTIATMASGL